MRIIEITEGKKEKMADYVEKMLHYGGRLMSCLEELDGDMGEREPYGSYGNRNYGSSYSRYGNRYDNYRGGTMYGNRDDDDDDDDEMEMGERRRRSRRTGRYM